MTSKHLWLYAVVFVSGMATMIFEIVGTRILAPFIGTSVFVWTSLIGVVLGALSVGNYWGGRISEKTSLSYFLSLVLAAAAFWIAGVAFFGDAFMLFSQKLGDHKRQALAAAFCLFAAPSALFGMVTPYAARLFAVDVVKTGRTAGSVYAWSNAGSVLGVFLAGFFLIGSLTHTTILLFLSTLLAFLACLGGGRRRLAMRVAAAAFLLFLTLASESLGAFFRGENFIDAETPYNRVWVFHDVDKKEEPVKVMQIADATVCRRYFSREELVVPYLRYFRLAEHFHPGLQKVLMIGGGAYAFAEDLFKRFPEIAVDVVEIDPVVTELARKHFGLENDARLCIIHEDGRTFLNRHPGPYDAIYMDVFNSFSVPFHLATAETMREVHRSLADDGVFVMNVVSAVEGDRGRFFRAVYRTVKTVFPQVYDFPVPSPGDGEHIQNQVIVALKTSAPPSWDSTNSEIHSFLSGVWKNPVLEDAPLLKDDFAPVEQLLMPVSLEARALNRNPILERLRYWKKKIVKAVF